MKILLTAFDPFGGEKLNPALEALKRVPDHISGAEVLKLEVPTVFIKSIAAVTAEMDRLRPDAVLCLGQAGGRFAITPERVAININDVAIPDNEGNQPQSAPIMEDGENAYFSSLPIHAMVQAIRAIGLPASISNTAGTFVCNQLMYGILHHIQKHYPNEMAGGFMHVPFIPAQVVNRQSPAPSMALEDIVKGIIVAVEAIGTAGPAPHPARGSAS